MKYTREDIKQAYKAIGVSKGKVVLVKTDLRYLGAFERPGREVLKAHFEALADLVDLDEGTIVVQTHSTSICNTDTPFDLNNTPSERGVLTEFVRKQKGVVRSRHPFMSYAAIGAQADYICKDVSRHSFGLESPKARMLDLDAMCVSIGLEPRLTCTYVHHMEMLMGVPYRYTKEFMHPMLNSDGSTTKEPFYMFVWYRDMDLNRDENKKIMQHYLDSGYRIREASLGRGRVFSYPCVDFCNSVASYLKNDIYGWTSTPPTKRPYSI